MSRAKRIWFGLAAVFAFAPALAQQPDPLVEISVDPAEVAVGEPITLRVSVYVPTWFTRPPQFPSFEVPNAITRLPDDSARPSSKRVGRDSWSGITRSYQVFPLMGARFRLESQDIDVRYANPGGDALRVQVPTGEISFAGIVPAGAEDLAPYVAGTRLEISRNVEGDPDSLSVGDALVVTYTAELDGLSAIFLPELVAPADVPGVSIYPEQAIIDDGVPARRTEKVTYIFNAGGDFEIPAVSVDWWNKRTSTVETAAVAALPLAVEGPLLQVDAADEAAEKPNWWAILAAVLVLLFLWQRLRRRAVEARDNFRERERQRRASEEYAWKRALKAIHSRDAHRAHDEIVRWLARLEPKLDSRSFAARYGDEKLAAELAKLNRVLYAQGEESVDYGRIGRRLSAARKRCLAERDEAREIVLPPLNP